MFTEIYHKCFDDIKSEKRSENFNKSFEKIITSNAAITIEDVAEVLYSAISDESIKKKIIETSSSIRNTKFHNQLSIIIPQYHSSRCIDNCKYCGFRESNSEMLRVILEDDDFEKEVNLLLDWGYRCIEFVYATDPFFTPEVIANRVLKAKQSAKNRNLNLKVGLNSNSFNVDGYKTLKQHDLDFMVLWIETYTEKYKDWHPKDTPKADFMFCLDTYDRVIQGGLEKYGLGILFGLGYWVWDVLMLMMHGLYLREKYGIDPYIIGIPRLKQAMGLKVEKSPWIIDDENYEFICFLYKLIFPNTKLFINTRENFEDNTHLISGGGDLFTIDCGTFPGAYLNPKIVVNGFEQFHTQYYEREKAIQSLTIKGFVPEFNW